MDVPSVTTVLEWLLLTLEVVLRIVALGVIPGNRKPSTGMAWLLLILIEPIIGFTIFLLVGRTALERKRVERQKEAIGVIRAYAERQDRFPTTSCRRRWPGSPTSTSDSARSRSSAATRSCSRRATAR